MDSKQKCEGRGCGAGCTYCQLMAADTKLTENERISLRITDPRVLAVIDALTAESEQLRAERDDCRIAYDLAKERGGAAEARLTTAEGYLKQVYPDMWACDEALRGILASAQPAATPCDHANGCTTECAREQEGAIAQCPNRRPSALEEGRRVMSQRERELEALLATVVGLLERVPRFLLRLAEPPSRLLGDIDAALASVQPTAPALTPPYAVLADGTQEPLQNCPYCGAMGFSRFAHMHDCQPSAPAPARTEAEAVTPCGGMTGDKWLKAKSESVATHDRADLDAVVLKKLDNIPTGVIKQWIVRDNTWHSLRPVMFAELARREEAK